MDRTAQAARRGPTARPARPCAVRGTRERNHHVDRPATSLFSLCLIITMLSNAYTGQATFRRQRLLRTLPVLRSAPFRLRAEALPRFLQLRHKGREVDALRSLERSPANTVIRSWRLRVAVWAQGDARVIRGLHRHPTIDSCVRRLVGCRMATRAACQSPDPGLVAFVACRAFARRTGAWADAFALR